MKYALDVNYENRVVGAIGFQNWSDTEISFQSKISISDIKPYKSGAFYERELPFLLKIVQELKNVEVLIVDGYVWLGSESRAGLGKRLYSALNFSIPIIGVAKSKFSGTPESCQVFRGKSSKPLYVTSIGIDLEKAKEYILEMSGEYRIPTLIKRVDTFIKEI
jgi:deoxyribonuclease V